jgi:uncharacterized protein
VALIFLIPGRDTTLRVNGRAAVTAAPDVLSWPDAATLPTSAEVTLAHQRDPKLTLEKVEERERDALANRLD